MEITTAALLSSASAAQFDSLLSLYPTALKLKAESKSKRPQELIKLDEWFQNELPGRIASRSPDLFISHEELVNCMRWKLARGKFRPRLKELVTMNSPRVVQQESRKAFRALMKKGDLSAAVGYLCNLKGIGPATASALLTAAAPDRAAFMADECLAAVPEIEGIDYTVAEYLEMMRAIGQASGKLGAGWTPHKIELVLWTHHVLLSLRPEMLEAVPAATGKRNVSSIESEPEDVDEADQVGGAVEDEEKEVDGVGMAFAAAEEEAEEDSNSNPPLVVEEQVEEHETVQNGHSTTEPSSPSPPLTPPPPPHSEQPPEKKPRL